MTIGVIISTYNNPRWLEKTLWGYEHQRRKADEIIIADDGSGEETRQLIGRYAQRLPIRHVWHEDRGFRKTTILNRALEQATADYLVFTDQDCIPRADFLATHERLARPGYMLSGGYFKLVMPVSQLISRDDVSSGRAFSIGWLRRQGQPLSWKMTKLVGNRLFTSFMNTVTPTRATWNGMNASGWRHDLLAVNGFDERMQYGGEDRELGERLMNMGIHARQIRYSAIVLHLDHNRPYVNDEAWQLNNEIRRATRRQHLVRTSYGINKEK
jgi:glycosyltransferase involved in cell wall biosynthesis